MLDCLNSNKNVFTFREYHGSTRTDLHPSHRNKLYTPQLFSYPSANNVVLTTDHDLWTVHPTSKIVRTFSTGGQLLEERNDRDLYEELLRRLRYTEPQQPPPPPVPSTPPPPLFEPLVERHQTKVDVLLTQAQHRTQVDLLLPPLAVSFAPVSITVPLVDENGVVVPPNRKVILQRSSTTTATEIGGGTAAAGGGGSTSINGINTGIHQFKIALPTANGGGGSTTTTTTKTISTRSALLDEGGFKTVEVIFPLPSESGSVEV